MFLVRYVDVSTKQERILGMTNISKISETSLLQSYTAVIEGLASHRKYKINVSTVTQHWIESSKQEAVTVQTGLAPPTRVREGVVTDTSIELLWDPAQGDAHGYEVVCLNFPEMPQEVTLSGQIITSVFVTWRPPPGEVQGYKLVFGLLSEDGRSPLEHLVQDTSYEITDLIPGSDYCVSIQSRLGSDTSRAVHREFSTYVTSSSFSVTWDSAHGGFDFHRVTVTNASVTTAVVIPRKERVAVVTGLVEGCTYNADVVNVSPGTQYTVTVAAASASSSNISPGVSRMINTNETAPGPPSGLEGEAVGSNGILLSWTVPPDSNNIDGYVIRYKEVCPYPDSTFTEVTKFLDIPETLLTDFTSGSTYHIEVAAISSAGVGAFTSWSVPISVGVDQLRPYTAYLFEVSAFTSDGEGQIASTMVRMPESAPEDPPQNFEILNMTSRSISVSWSSPNIVTGKFSYMLYLYGPTGLETLAPTHCCEIRSGIIYLHPSCLFFLPGYLYENSTGDMQFTFAGLNPYTRYMLEVRAKAAGEVGPSVQTDLITPAEAPSAVQDLQAEAEDSVSIRVSWRSPAQPNGLITRYRLQVLVDDVPLQDITLHADVNTTSLTEDETMSAGVHDRRKRSVDLSLVTPPLTFTATLSDQTLPSTVTLSSSAHSSDQLANTNSQLTVDSTISHLPESSTNYSSALLSTNFQSAGSAVSRTAVFVPTSVPPATLPPWLTRQTQAGGETSLSPSFALTPGQLFSSTHGTANTGPFSTRGAAVSGSTGGSV
ncbi:unnamed protein product [Tetraodon nigroviridis]|uniref:(spotted green pufferfish) hypothetical protein n=1 Tax=Tetraodon nigroviridis TaxID=99883 RepID=Q4REW7_TETNG|nr:unnamed protein product [Tetraodon nigroviridis]